MRNFLVIVILLLSISAAASAQMMGPGFGGMMGVYGNTTYNATNITSYGSYMPGFGMMGGYGYGGCPYGGMMGPGMMSGYGYYPYSGMMGMMSGGMMGGYGYAPGFGTPFGYGYNSNSLLWIAVVILVGTTAYLLGKRSRS